MCSSVSSTTRSTASANCCPGRWLTSSASNNGSLHDLDQSVNNRHHRTNAGTAAPVVVATVLPLDLQVTRISPEEIQLDWSDDADAAVFVVTREGFELARVSTLTLIDAPAFCRSRPSRGS